MSRTDGEQTDVQYSEAVFQDVRQPMFHGTRRSLDISSARPGRMASPLNGLRCRSLRPRHRQVRSPRPCSPGPSRFTQGSGWRPSGSQVDRPAHRAALPPLRTGTPRPTRPAPVRARACVQVVPVRAVSAQRVGWAGRFGVLPTSSIRAQARGASGTPWCLRLVRFGAFCSAPHQLAKACAGIRRLHGSQYRKPEFVARTATPHRPKRTTRRNALHSSSMRAACALSRGAWANVNGRGLQGNVGGLRGVSGPA